jgi:hypothetical protein
LSSKAYYMLSSQPLREGQKGYVQMKKHLVRLATVMTLVMLFTSLASAVSPLILVKGKSVGRNGVVLPMAVELDAAELEQIEGEGLISGVLGAVAGAITGAISYTTGYLWDAYIDDALENLFGDGNAEEDDDPVWQWSSFYDSAGKGVITGFFGGLLLP